MLILSLFKKNKPFLFGFFLFSFNPLIQSCCCCSRTPVSKPVYFQAQDSCCIWFKLVCIQLHIKSGLSMTIFSASDGVNFYRMQHGLCVTDTSAHRIQFLAVRPLCCMSVIKFLCVLEIMKMILLSRSLSLSLSCYLSSTVFPLVLLQGALIAHC